jgi:hypothetical protein
LEDLRERGCFGDLDVDGRTKVKWILKIQGAKAWAGFSWHRIVCSYCTCKDVIIFRFHKIRKLSDQLSSDSPS